MDDAKWFKTHLKELREKYEGKLIAVLNGKIVAVDKDLQGLGRNIIEMKRAGKIKGTPFIGKASADPAAIHIPTVFA